MKTLRWLFAIPLLLPFAGCNETVVKNEACNASIVAYNRMLRWKEYEPAEKAVAAAVREEFRRRLSQKDLQIADYRIKSITCDAAKGEAEVVVEYDYMLPPSTKLQSVEDRQRWGYFEDAVPPGWRVVTPPPDFVR